MEGKNSEFQLSQCTVCILNQACRSSGFVCEPRFVTFYIPCSRSSPQVVDMCM